MAQILDAIDISDNPELLRLIGEALESADRDETDGAAR